MQRAGDWRRALTIGGMSTLMTVINSTMVRKRCGHLFAGN